MSDDIVDRLLGLNGAPTHSLVDRYDAAEEIKRLRAELAAASSQADMWKDMTESAQAERDALRAQLAEAREALEWLVTLKDEKDACGKTPLYEARKKAAWGSARAVLEKIKGGVDE